jgi:hypothetical protein
MSIPWNTETEATLIEYYKERGQWARHYSAVRLTLGTFFVTLSFGILQFRWDTPELKVGVVLLTCAFGVFLFILFSKYTFDEMKGQMEIVNSFREANSITLIDLKNYDWLNWRKTFSGLPVAIIFFVLFAAVDAWWVCS